MGSKVKKRKGDAGKKSKKLVLAAAPGALGFMADSFRSEHESLQSEECSGTPTCNVKRHEAQTVVNSRHIP